MNKKVVNQAKPNNTPTLLEAYRELSRSECRVLKKMSEGKSNFLIAEELFISPKTVENHITNIGVRLSLKGSKRIRNWLQDLDSN